LSRENKEEGRKRKRKRNKRKRRERKKVENGKQKEKVVETEKKKGKSEANIEKKKEATPIECKEVPYPLLPSRKDKQRHLARFLHIFKKLEITLPFREALQQMPLYAKILKDMLTKKNQYIHCDKIVVEGNYSAVIQHILPAKHKDPGVVTIPCSIGEVTVGKALIDLGTSINLMPLSMCRRLGKIETMPTHVTRQLADRSITRPYGVIEDVLIQVKQLVFPADFVVMDIEEYPDIPIILGRPFMSMTNCIVDIGKGKLELSAKDQKVSFDLFEEINHPNDLKARFDLDKVEQEIEIVATTMALHSPLEKA